MSKNEITITVPYTRFKKLEEIEKGILEKKTVLIKTTTEHGWTRHEIYEFLTDEEIVKIASEVNCDLNKRLENCEKEIKRLNKENESLNSQIFALKISAHERKWYQLFK